MARWRGRKVPKVCDQCSAEYEGWPSHDNRCDECFKVVKEAAYQKKLRDKHDERLDILRAMRSVNERKAETKSIHRAMPNR